MSNNRGRIPPRNGKVQRFADKKQKLKFQLDSVEQQIYANLMDGKNLAVSDKKKPYIDEQTQATVIQQRYNRLLKQKKNKEVQLEKIKHLEDQYYTKLQKSRIVEPPSNSLPKSTLEKQDKQKLHKIKRELDKFQKNLQQKNLELKRMQLEEKLRQRQEKQKQKEEKKEMRKVEVNKKMQEINFQSQERKKRLQLEKKRLKDISQQRKLYEVLDKSWQQKNQQEEQKKYKIMQERYNSQKVDFSELREHEKKYEEIMMEKRRELNEKRMEVSRMTRKSQMSLEKSRYYTMVVREDRKMREEEERKKGIGKQIRDKRLKYASYVKEQFAPRIKTPEQGQETGLSLVLKSTEVSPKKDPRLSPQEIKLIGNRNFIEAQKLIKKKDSKKRQEQVQKQQNQKQTKAHYPDYLSQIRKKKLQTNSYKTIQPKDEATRIMQDKTISKQQKITKIKMLAERYNSRSDDIVSKVIGKLQILQILN